MTLDHPLLYSIVHLKNVALLNQVRRSLGDGIKGAGQVARNLEGQDRSVNNSDILGTVNPELGVDNTAFVPRQHAGSANWVEV